ncbi:hypothetical protein [Testudinibacter aquarius]|uniref:Accessory Sec system protein Asp2 n=1 Tax=Testudinibacter aquarius TaxID=1524974 RepID=A0A4R3Y4Y4_9PAST|nr:hypothetical protein [Testudinibacter aquarius]KAE9530131.1 hypothetical protein A1D24_07275 [Testudinibacter aquarius]TCV86632.1 hypothetical protein EDC16_106189 [Testudinibacter aquarius]TNG91669.1 hypothetical protein FHQ21_06900 [Testudinibacter aquarius]
MNPEESFIATNGVQVKYKHKKSKYDFDHVIFVFSGFLNYNPGNYDFANALNECPCDVVWINDDFDKMYAYYLCKGMDFSIEEAVTEFICDKISELKLDNKKATVTGFSKGGSAALYYGLKLNIRNIVATVPQLHIGSYIVRNWKHVAQHMMGNMYALSDIGYLDKLILKALRSDTALDKNVYLLTSEADIQYPVEIQPYLNDFAKYQNFNLLKTHSGFVREHNQITGHHVALLLSIYYGLASEAVPRYNNGNVEFFGKLLTGNKQPSGELIYDLRIAKIIDGRLFLEGAALLRGHDIVEYSDLNYYLLLQNGDSVIRLELAKSHRPSLTKEFFDGKHLTIYDKAWFTTYQHKGIDICILPKGKYRLSIGVKLASGIDKHIILLDKRNITLVTKTKEYELIIQDKALYLNIL